MKSESTRVSNLKMAARQNQSMEQNNITFLMHNFMKPVIQAEGGLWVSLIVCDIQENSSFSNAWESLAFCAGFFFHQALITKPKDFAGLNSETCFSHSLYSAPSSGLHGDSMCKRGCQEQESALIPPPPQHPSPPMYPVAIKYTWCDLILIMGFSHTLTQPWGDVGKSHMIPTVWVVNESFNKKKCQIIIHCHSMQSCVMGKWTSWQRHRIGNLFVVMHCYHYICSSCPGLHQPSRIWLAGKISLSNSTAVGEKTQ